MYQSESEIQEQIVEIGEAVSNRPPVEGRGHESPEDTCRTAQPAAFLCIEDSHIVPRDNSTVAADMVGIPSWLDP